MTKHITFSIRKTDSGKVTGQISGCVMQAGKAIFLTSPFDGGARETFPEAVELAQLHGIPQINIDDPHGLFPSLGFGPTRS